MSSGTKSDKTASATVQPATSEKLPGPDPSGGAERRPPRLQNLGALLARENVEFMLVLAGAKTVRVGATLSRGGQDSKTFDVGDEGCWLIIKLSDNPAGVGAGFSEMRPEVRDES